MKKGLSIPINTLIILVVAVVVLLGVVVFFMSGFGESSSGVSCESKLKTGCSSFVLRGGCEVDDSGTPSTTTKLSSDDAEGDFDTLIEGLNCTAGITDPTYEDAQDYCCD